MPLPDSYLQILRECSRDEGAFQRLVALMEPVFDARQAAPPHVNEVIDLEAQLREKHAELEHFFAMSLDLWCIANTDGYFLRVSPMWEATLGYSLEELTGHRFLDFVHPDDLQATLDTVAALDAQNTILNFVNRYRCKDGSYRFVEWRSRPQGKLIYAAARDVTERQRLEAYQSRLVAIIESSNDAIIGETLDGIITDWNPAAEAMYGYTAAEVVGQHISLIVPPDRKHEIMLLLAAIRRGLVIQHHETMRLRKNGSRLNVSLTVSPIKDKNGTIVGTSVIAQDITELKQARDALRDSEARLRSIVETMDDAVWSIELPDLQMTYLNPAGYHIFGRSQEDFSRRPEMRLKLVHPDDVALAQAGFETTLNEGRAELEFRIIRPDGEIRWVHSRSRLVKDHQGHPVRIEGLLSDITDHKLAQQRALELEMEQERVRLLNDFITNTSHELRTPLTIIASYVYMMTHLDDRQQREAKAARVEEQIHYLATMIEELHQMVTLDQLAQLDTVSIRLNQFVKTLVTDYSSQKPTITITCDLASDIPDIRGDPYYLTLALTHLLDNAVRFSPEGSEVIVRTAFEEGEAVLEIEDRGIGIAAEHHDRIFERFFKINAARTRNDEGAGMGLALVRRIMELHQGRVTVRSQVGQGTTFSLHFPAATIYPGYALK